MSINLRPNATTKRILVIVSCLILLFAALFFRWGQVGTKTVEGAKVTYETDRWTGRTWIRLHGVTDNGKLVEGTEAPYISDNETTSKVAEIIAGPIGEKRKRYLQRKKEETIKKLDQVKEGHTQYVQMYEKYEHEFNTSVIYTLPFSKLDPSYGIDVALAKESYILERIPEEVHSNNRKWKAYKNKLKTLNNQMKDISDWATTEAEKMLKAKAYTARKIATGIWFFLLTLVLLGASILRFLDRKESHSEPI